MFIIGFELEFISAYNRNELKSLLKEAFPRYKSKLQIVEDVTIASTKKMPYRHEIITPPLPQDEAISLLKDLYEWLNANKCAANKSTGFHVNVSFAEKLLNKWLNPLHVVDATPINDILSRWGRTNNRYCRPFDFYFDIIQKRVKMMYKPKKWTTTYSLCEYSHDEVQRMSEIRFIAMVADCSEEHGDVYTQKAYDVWDIGQGKHVCINLHYLKQRGYIEFRMIGGAKYLTEFDEVLADINTILASMIIALNRSTAE